MQALLVSMQWLQGGGVRTRQKTGSGLKGCCASCVSTYAAAAWPNSAGVVPSTGMVRTLKFGTTCQRKTVHALQAICSNYSELWQAELAVSEQGVNVAEHISARCMALCSLATDTTFCAIHTGSLPGVQRTWKSDRLPPPVLSTSLQRGLSVLSSTCSLRGPVSATTRVCCAAAPVPSSAMGTCCLTRRSLTTHTTLHSSVHMVLPLQRHGQHGTGVPHSRPNMCQRCTGAPARRG